MSQLLTAEFIQQAKHKLAFNSNKVQIENKAFRFFSRVTFSILLVSCGLVTLQQLIGAHIKCISPPKEDVRPDAVAQYCFIMSTFTIPNLLNRTVGVDVAHPGVGPYDPVTDDPKYHAYYQWVPFVLFFQALLFLVPHTLWKGIEGGLLKAYCTLKVVDDHQLKHRYVMDEEKESKKEEKEKKISLAAEYFIAHMGSNARYAYGYVFAEVLNFAIVILNIYMTDAFLGYEFSTYGPEVINFLSQDPENRLDPMSRVFPKVTKCKFHKFGPSGNLINYDVMCVLALNIVNEKIYTFLWFWFVILAVIGGLALVYRIIVMFAQGLRNHLISYRVLTHDRDPLQDVVEKMGYPDWFILRRLGDNINRLRFGELCESIRNQMPGMSTTPVLSASSASSPDPYSKGGKFYDPDQQTPLINNQP